MDSQTAGNLGGLSVLVVKLGFPFHHLVIILFFSPAAPSDPLPPPLSSLFFSSGSGEGKVAGPRSGTRKRERGRGREWDKCTGNKNWTPIFERMGL
ncbi:unnamed protein product [Prunus armeniaca]|uniref:Uncharacterized protein n=1 Tax=Prunus armeniaca TaxID=36596 RepID=A0A6J5XIF4_PRUAR|nr:unnamed protein product [Prunus armeniaca]